MRIQVIDAFTDQCFAGNPAAVCLLDHDEWPSTEWMQQIAAEMKHSETAFARPLPTGGDADWALRWFTPTVEVPLCGHATLATAHALRGTGWVADLVRFASRSGVLTAAYAPDETITLDFPAAGVTQVPDSARLAEALGAVPVEMHRAPARRTLLVLLRDEKAVRDLAPDLALLVGYSRDNDLHGVICTAAAGTNADFVSRFFAPASGIPEDPVTGGAHTVLAPFWSARLGRSDLVGRQVSARGGTIRTRLRDDRVLLAGRAVTVLDGRLTADAIASLRDATAS